MSGHRQANFLATLRKNICRFRINDKKEILDYRN